MDEDEQMEDEQIFQVFQQFNNNHEVDLFETSIKFIELYKKFIKCNQYYRMTFNRDTCFTLKFLYIGLVFNNIIQKYEYFKLESDTVYEIEIQILNHFQKLLLANIDHGKLKLKNIIIELTPDSEKLSAASKTLRIENVYFVRYKFKEESTSDYKKILSILSKLDQSQQFDQIALEQNNSSQLSKQNQKANVQRILDEIKINRNRKQKSFILQYLPTRLTNKITDPRYRWSTYFSETLIEIKNTVYMTNFDFSQQYEQFPNHQMQQSKVLQQFLKELVCIYKEIVFEKGLLKRIEEIGRWYNLTYFSWNLNWVCKLEESEKLIQNELNLFPVMLENLDIYKIYEKYEEIRLEIQRKYDQHFKLDIKLEQDKLIEIYLEQILFKFQENQHITTEESTQLLRTIIESVYDEEVQLQILQLIQELI